MWSSNGLHSYGKWQEGWFWLWMAYSHAAEVTARVHTRSTHSRHVSRHLSLSKSLELLGDSTLRFVLRGDVGSQSLAFWELNGAGFSLEIAFHMENDCHANHDANVLLAGCLNSWEIYQKGLQEKVRDTYSDELQVFCHFPTYLATRV